MARSARAQIGQSGHALVLDTLTDEVNKVCREVMAGYSTDDLLHENTHAGGSVVLQIDTPRTAVLAATLANTCYADLANYDTLALAIPLGAIVGSTTWADRGKKTTYTIEVTYSVACDYTVCHEAVGINQVRYALYLQLVAEAHITVPRQIEDARYVCCVPVCEKIYSGEVPNVYVNGQDATNYLDLLPD